MWRAGGDTLLSAGKRAPSHENLRSPPAPSSVDGGPLTPLSVSLSSVPPAAPVPLRIISWAAQDAAAFHEACQRALRARVFFFFLN